MMRVCHLNTCPVGVATQDPELRKKFTGKPEFVENFFRFIAEEVRELMAELGFRTMDEMIGRVDRLDVQAGGRSLEGARARLLARSCTQPAIADGASRRRTRAAGSRPRRRRSTTSSSRARRRRSSASEPVAIHLPIRNVNRTVGTMLGYEMTRRYGGDGLPDDTIRMQFTGSAGQSFGAFVPRGITLTLEGDANDYVGKGLSGGTADRLPADGERRSSPEDNIIIGNVALYGATERRGVLPRRRRRAVRACATAARYAVVEGVGDHGCEYMTGGRVVVLGRTGRNFAAGMSGGVAYVLDADGAVRAALQHRAWSISSRSRTRDDIELRADADRAATSGIPAARSRADALLGRGR